MDSEKVRKFLYIAFQALVIILGLLIFTNIYNIESTKKPDDEIKKILAKQQQDRLRLAEGKHTNESLPDNWPPKMNELYPALPLIGLDANETTLPNLMGKVVVLEFVDMSSPVSQAQSGAVLLGAYGETRADDLDKSVVTFEDAFRRTSQNEDITFPNQNTVHVKVVVYAQDGGQASLDDAQSWADHFDLKADDNVVLLVPKNDIRSDEVQAMISGYQLIDKKGRLRVDSAGVAPKHNLQLTLIPLAEKLMR